MLMSCTFVGCEVLWIMNGCFAAFMRTIDPLFCLVHAVSIWPTYPPMCQQMVSCVQDPETYIHRSGRTGRAGSTGTSVTLVDRKKEGLIPFIQKRAGVSFERIGAPQPSEMARIAGVPEHSPSALCLCPA
jgi:hypothetical protein